MHTHKFKLVQPPGVNYLTQKTFYSFEDAQEYLNRMIEGTSQAIKDKLNRKRLIPTRSVDSLQEQLERLYEFTIEPVGTGDLSWTKAPGR